MRSTLIFAAAQSYNTQDLIDKAGKGFPHSRLELTHSTPSWNMSGGNMSAWMGISRPRKSVPAAQEALDGSDCDHSVCRIGDVMPSLIVIVSRVGAEMQAIADCDPFVCRSGMSCYRLIVPSRVRNALHMHKRREKAR